MISEPINTECTLKTTLDNCVDQNQMQKSAESDLWSTLFTENTRKMGVFLLMIGYLKEPIATDSNILSSWNKVVITITIITKRCKFEWNRTKNSSEIAFTKVGWYLIRRTKLNLRPSLIVYRKRNQHIKVTLKTEILTLKTEILTLKTEILLRNLPGFLSVLYKDLASSPCSSFVYRSCKRNARLDYRWKNAILSVFIIKGGVFGIADHSE